MAENPDEHWIEHAHLNKGSFGKKAKAAGMSTSKYAKKEEHAKGKTGKQARLAETFSKMRGKK